MDDKQAQGAKRQSKQAQGERERTSKGRPPPPPPQEGVGMCHGIYMGCEGDQVHATHHEFFSNLKETQ